jgi:hypothetical protein
MHFEPFLNPLILIPTGIVVILDFISLPFFLVWASSGKTKKANIILLFKPLTTLVCIYFMFTQFGGGFFLGAVYPFAALIIAFYMFIVYVILMVTRRKELGFPKLRFIRNLIFGLLIVITIAIPPLAYLPIVEECSLSNSVKIPIISKAMESYYQDHGEYPEELDELVPLYLPSLPVPSCHFLYGATLQFHLRSCSGSEPVIYVPTIDGVGGDFYDLENGEHSRVQSFLDFPDPGHCP